MRGSAPCFPASKPAVLSWISRALLDQSAREPVVKSCSREPTASSTSASRARPLAAAVPVTPMEPTFRRWVQVERALAGLGLRHRYAMALGEGGKLGAGLAVMHAAAAEQKRGLGG